MIYHLPHKERRPQKIIWPPADIFQPGKGFKLPFPDLLEQIFFYRS